MGCHQLPERSFQICGHQFPLCARCTGICMGYIFAGVLTPFVQISWKMASTFCLIMFLDWLLQYVQLKMSTNFRRFVTGTLCGYGLMSLYWKLIHALIEMSMMRRG